MMELHAEFRKNMQELLGNDLPAFLRALDAPPALAMRVNSLRAAAMHAAEEYMDQPVPWAKDAFYLRPGARPGAAIAHAAGAYYLQEASAMAPAAVLDVQPGERVLDLCAAPGGKSGQLAASLKGQGILVCNEPEPGRAKILAGNLERLGVTSAVVTNAYPDAISRAWPGFFDAVLVDAPCSGEGMFRRDPDARGEWTPSAPEGCARRQREILAQAAKLVRPGGRLVYSTCTYNPLENEGSALRFLQEHPDFSPVEFALPGVGASENGMLRLLPHLIRGDGQFIAKFQRSGYFRPSFQAPSRAKLPEADAFLQEILLSTDFLRHLPLQQMGQWIYAVPAELPAAKGVRVVSPGLCLLRAQKNRFEPEHALAMALSPDCARRKAALHPEQARQDLSGEALPFEGERGWTLVTVSGMPLGWGKSVDGILKNHLPKGLRRSMHDL